MIEIVGAQQGDAWLKARCGRVTGSRLADVVDFVWKGSKTRGDKRVESGAKRKKYRRELIAERLTGLLADHWYSEYMARGEREEEPARIFYEELTGRNIIPVSFVIHPQLPFSGASADGLIGKDGVFEAKNPNTTTHLAYREDGIVPEEYVPQVAWEMASAGPERRYAAFLSFDRRIHNPKLCYFLKTVGRDELEWEVPEGDEGKYRKLTGEAVIDYFTEHVAKFSAEIDYFIAENGGGAVAPYEVAVREEREAVSDAPFDPSHPEFDYLDETLADVP